jgi:hypothetical protein
MSSIGDSRSGGFMSTASQTVSVTRSVEVPADALWRVLRTGRDVHRILPGLVRSCEMTGEGPGARRMCGTDHGAIEETLLTVDDDARVFRYRIDAQPLMPLRDYVGTVHVTEGAGGRAHVLWPSSFELLDPAAERAVVASLRDLLAAGIAGLTTLAREAV